MLLPLLMQASVMFKLKKARAQVYKLAPLLNASLQFSMLLVLWFSISFASD